MSLAEELLEEFEPEIESIKLIPSDGGCFELVVNNSLVFSKLSLRRHADPGEIVGLMRNLVERG